MSSDKSSEPQSEQGLSATPSGTQGNIVTEDDQQQQQQQPTSDVVAGKELSEDDSDRDNHECHAPMILRAGHPPKKKQFKTRAEYELLAAQYQTLMKDGKYKNDYECECGMHNREWVYVDSDDEQGKQETTSSDDEHWDREDPGTGANVSGRDNEKDSDSDSDSAPEDVYGYAIDSGSRYKYNNSDSSDDDSD